MITAKQWEAYHRARTKKQDWRDVYAVIEYLKKQRPGPFSMPFWTFSKIFKAHYARLCYGDIPKYGFFSVSREEICRYWQAGFMPSQAARWCYDGWMQTEQAEYEDWAKEEQAWRNFAATGDPDVSAHDLYKYDGIGWDQ